MAVWDRLKEGVQRAEQVAAGAIDEGRLRLDARRARQAADHAAQALGYAVVQAWEQGRVLEGSTVDRLARAVREREQDAIRLEQQATAAAGWRGRPGAAAADPAMPPPPAPEPPSSEQAPPGPTSAARDAGGP
jgi:hypothetical protein